MISGGFAGGGSDVSNINVISYWGKIIWVIGSILVLAGATTFLQSIFSYISLLFAVVGAQVFVASGWILPAFAVIDFVLVLALIILMLYLLYLIIITINDLMIARIQPSYNLVLYRSKMVSSKHRGYGKWC